VTEVLIPAGKAGATEFSDTASGTILCKSGLMIFFYIHPIISAVTLYSYRLEWCDKDRYSPIR